MRHLTFEAPSNRGVALLVSVAVLGMLSVLGVTFIRLMSHERLSASNAALSVRARMVAHAGIAQAIGQLQAFAIDHPCSDLADAWVFRTDDGEEVGCYPGTLLEDARFPSLPFDKDGDGVFENGTATPATHDLVHGRAISGMISGVGATGAPPAPTGLNYARNHGLQHYDDDGLVYKLAIRDSASKLNINGQQASLPAILDYLGKAILAIELTDPIMDRGAAIIAARDTLFGGQFCDLDELVGLPLIPDTLAPLTAAEVQYLESYVTCVSWRDATTIKPDPQSDPDALPVLSVEPRNPVNVNTAPLGLLRALIVGLKGYERRVVAGADVYMAAATAIEEKAETTAIGWTEAGRIAEVIGVARRLESFRTWSQLRTFVAGLRSSSGLSGLTDGQLDVLWANFNPNTLVARFNPNQVRAHPVAKLDLTYYSTELCFSSGGYFEIECVGLVTAHQGQVAARANQRAVVQVLEIVRHTSQSEFESNRVANTRTATHPESIVDLGSTGSMFDGQIEMLVPPPTVPRLSYTAYCYRVTSSATSHLPSNHIVTSIPAANIARVMSTATNDAGLGIVAVASDASTGLTGYKFSTCVLGGKGKVESITSCFAIARGALTSLSIGIKVGSETAVVSIPLNPPSYSPVTTVKRFVIELISVQDVDSEGETGTGTPPAQFYASFYDMLDAVSGYSTDWAGANGIRAKLEGVSVFSGSSLMPDGMLSSRGMAQELGYECAGNMRVDKGTLELWVKMVNDGLTGSNEVLFYSALPTVIPTQQPWEGVTTTMERWGAEIITTRAYVGHPDAAVSPHVLGCTESIAHIADWKPHEWHHIAVAYFDTIDHRMYVDGKLVSDTFRSLSGERSFALVSNAPANEMTIGGYEFTSPTAVSMYRRGVVIVAGKNERFSNTTISDFKVYTSDEIFPAAGFTPDDKFAANPAVPTAWRGKFSLSRDYPVTVCSVSWTEYQPTQWGAQTYNAVAGAADTDVRVRVKVGANPWRTVPTPEALGGDGRGYTVGDSLPASDSGTDVKTVEYELTFTGSIDPFNVTPSIDDIQIALAIPPRILLWKSR